MKKTKTPEDIADEKHSKQAYNLYLDVSMMDYIKQRASNLNISASAIVNEAITSYVNHVKKRKKG